MAMKTFQCPERVYHIMRTFTMSIDAFAISLNTFIMSKEKLPYHRGNWPCHMVLLPCPMISVPCPWRLCYIPNDIYHIYRFCTYVHGHFHHIHGHIYHLGNLASCIQLLTSWGNMREHAYTRAQVGVSVIFEMQTICWTKCFLWQRHRLNWCSREEIALRHFRQYGIHEHVFNIIHLHEQIMILWWTARAGLTIIVQLLSSNI
jgi:hypothetical protein